MSFSELGLSEDLLRAVTDAGYTEPTPIQAQAIPVVLMGRDVLGCAQTGTGKTASFTLPMIEILASGRAKARMPRSLILEPTRELAAQVAENFETYGKYHKLSKALLIGGTSMADQLKVLSRGVDVLIATPGRLLDVFDRGHLLMTDVRTLVIDEADRMLDMGFIPDVEKIVSLLSPMRTTLFFSATMPPEIKRLADKFLSNPKEITVTRPAATADTITQGLLVVSHNDGRKPGGGQKEKRAALRQLMQRDDPKNALIFCNRKRDVDIVWRSLNRHGFVSERLHGDMDQSTRMATLEKFKSGGFKYMVCSDVAARGLDIPEMSHVFNFDVPTHADDYVHRIGRTGRAGHKGHAYTLATPEDTKYLDAIERVIKIKIPPIKPGDAQVDKHGDAQASDPAPVEQKSSRRRSSPRRGKNDNSKLASPETIIEQEAKAESPKPEQNEPQEAKPQEIESAPAATEKPKRARKSTKASSRKEQLPDVQAHANGLGDNVPAFLKITIG